MTTGRINQVTSLLPAMRAEARKGEHGRAAQGRSACTDTPFSVLKVSLTGKERKCFQPLCVWVVQTRALQGQVALFRRSLVSRRSGAVLISSFHKFPRRARAAQFRRG